MPRSYSRATLIAATQERARSRATTDDDDHDACHAVDPTIRRSCSRRSGLHAGARPAAAPRRRLDRDPLARLERLPSVGDVPATARRSRTRADRRARRPCVADHASAHRPRPVGAAPARPSASANAQNSAERAGDREHERQRDLVAAPARVEQQERADRRTRPAPASVSAPWLRHERSATKKPDAASSISSSPAQLTGSTEKPKSAEDQARSRRPRREARGRGSRSRRPIPSEPSESSSAMMFGSISVSRIRLRSRDSHVVDLGAGECAARSPCGIVLSPSICVSSAGQRRRDRRRSRSCSSASARGEVRRLAHGASAHFALRPWLFASARSDAAASLHLAAQVAARCPRRPSRSASTSRCSSAAPSRARPPPGRSRRRPTPRARPSGAT